MQLNLSDAEAEILMEALNLAIEKKREAHKHLAEAYPGKFDERDFGIDQLASLNEKITRAYDES